MAEEIPDMEGDLERLREIASQTLALALEKIQVHDGVLRRGIGEHFFPNNRFDPEKFKPAEIVVLPETAIKMI